MAPSVAEASHMVAARCSYLGKLFRTDADAESHQIIAQALQQ